MPYTGPHITASGGLMSQDAAETVSKNISKALERYHEEKKKKEFNQGVFEYMSQQSDTEGNPYIPTESLAKWNSMNPDAQAGVLSLAAARMKEDQSARMEAIRAKQERDAEAGSSQVDPYTDPISRQPVPGMGIVRKTGAVVRSNGSDLPPPGTPVYADDGSQLGVYDAKGKITKLTAAKGSNDPMAKMQMEMNKDEIDALDKQALVIQQHLSKGEEKWGGAYNPLSVFATPYRDQLQALQLRKAQLQEKIGGKSDVAAPTGAMTASADTAAAAPVQIASDADYNALPSGAIFIDPDGKRRRKP